ncbi:hypothetical protein [Cellulophaga sp. L1A9]|uniref:hypothetical protein n=1 Tax=Cellulophaga sp. L1A9 TaxID=2686362 RepID=UPI00131C6498|nr:hypothetical protein [Cellulophaga sp. L1A9]
MKKPLKYIISILSLIILVALFIGCKLTDLRPQGYEYPNNIEKAKYLLEEMGKAHQIEKWNDIETYNVIFEDEFYGFLGERTHGFKEQKMEFSLNYIPKTFDGQLKILNGKEKSEIWGIQSGNTYRLDEKGNLKVEENKNMKFYIPTYQYFIEFPSRIQEATAIDYLGTKMINGAKAEGIIASWNTVEPQNDLDQYVIWIDAISKRIIKIAYTVRDKYRFVSGVAHYQDYKEYNGIILPSTMPVESNLLKKGFLHKMSIVDFKINQLDRELLLPIK